MLSSHKFRIILNPADIYLLKISNVNLRRMRKIYSKLTIKTPEQRVSLLLALIKFHALF